MNLALVGRKRSGKDTVARHLTERHGYTRLAFADPLKDAALALNPIVGEDDFISFRRRVRLARLVTEVGWERAKDEYPEVRRILQRLGDEAGRQIHGADLWTNHMASRLDHSPRPWVITDVRYPNEAELATGRGAVLVRVTRSSHSSDTTDDHASERDVDRIPCAFELHNDSDLSHLLDATDSLIRDLNN